MSCCNNRALALGWVPHLRDGFIVAKVGIAHQRGRSPHTPIDDIRSTAGYRAAVAANLLDQFLRSLTA